MLLDPLTMFVAALICLALISGLMLLSWFLNRQIRALLIWSGAFMLACLGFAGMVLAANDAHNTMREAANALAVAGYGLSVAASRQFNGRRTHWAVVVGGSAIWLLACWGLNIDTAARMTLVAVLCAGYTFAIAAELWFGSRERLLSQRAAALLCLFHGGYFVLRIISGPTLLRSIPWAENIDSLWALMLAVETLVFSVSFGFLILSMAKEKIEARHRRAAMQDPLTGINNRRAFKDRAERRLEANRQAGRASSILLMDLDHFKQINDRYGHDAGDQVLVGFTTLVNNLLEPEDLFCRMGGEEFAVFLSDASTDRALDVAETIRAILDLRGLGVDDGVVPATVSIGVVSSSDPDASLRSLLAHADAALYDAKASGRNRAVTYGAQPRRALTGGATHFDVAS